MKNMGNTEEDELIETADWANVQCDSDWPINTVHDCGPGLVLHLYGMVMGRIPEKKVDETVMKAMIEELELDVLGVTLEHISPTELAAGSWPETRDILQLLGCLAGVLKYTMAGKPSHLSQKEPLEEITLGQVPKSRPFVFKASDRTMNQGRHRTIEACLLLSLVFISSLKLYSFIQHWPSWLYLYPLNIFSLVSLTPIYLYLHLCYQQE